MELQLTMSLTGKLALEYGKKENMKEKGLLLYAKEIQRALETPEFCHLQDTGRFLKWFKGSPDVWRNIRGMKTTAVPDKNGLFADMIFYCRQALNASQQKELADYVDDQFAYGMGKKLLSHPISVPGGELRIQMWEPFSSEFQVDWMNEPAALKYRITDIRHPLNPKFRRIQALCDINPNVQKGDLGGYVEKEWNLSQQGKCWIYDDAVSCECAKVQKDAQMFGFAQAKGWAMVTGEASMSGHSLADGQTYVKDAAIKDHAIICGEAVAESYGNNPLSPVIGGNSKIYGTVSGWFAVSDSTVFPGEKLSNPTKDMMVLEHGQKRAFTKAEMGNGQMGKSARKANPFER